MPRPRLIALLALLLLPGAARAAPVRTAHLETELVAESATVAPGSTVYVAIRQAIIPGWHTYWRNPGDAGEPTQASWTLPPGWQAGDIVWPAPERVMTGPLANYVFSGQVLLPVPITVPASAKPGPATLSAKVDWLVCKDVCVPEQASLTLPITVAPGAPKPDPRWSGPIARTLAASPKPAALKARFAASGAMVRLSVAGAAVQGAPARRAYFYPYDGTVIDHAKSQAVQTGQQGLTLTLPAGYAFTKGKPPTHLAGVLSLGPGRAYELDAQPGAPLPGTAGAAAPAATDPSGGGGAQTGAGEGAPAAGMGLLAALGAAVLGGLILNLMPCVFPVLSMKAAQLVRHTDRPAAARAEGLAFLAGCVATFVALAALLIALKAAGQEVGWGFQLQSPAVVAVLALVMLAAALNLSGVFEIGLSVQGAGQELAARPGLAGAFFTGALAVVVAAPCTAPFMAGAIGWALTQPAWAALSVFAALGLGLALPYVLVAFIPALFRRLPRPGAWMEGLRRVLAFPMYGAAAWLAWVFVEQVGADALPFLFGAAIALGFAAWAWGVGQRSARAGVPRLAALAGLLLAAPLIALGAGRSPPTTTATGQAAAAQTAAPQAAPGALPVEPWSAERVSALVADHRPVFVDFTAAWCVTCQVNERTALAGAEVAKAFKRTGAAYLKADWTRYDPRITQALSAQGRSGVPLYLVYRPGEAQPRVLPQILSEGAVVEALEGGAKG